MRSAAAATSAQLAAVGGQKAGAQLAAAGGQKAGAATSVQLAAVGGQKARAATSVQVWVAVAMAGVGGACGGTAAPPPPPPGTQVAQAIVAAMEAAGGQKAPWRCAAPDGPKLAEETVAVGGREWKLAGETAQLGGGGPIAIGVVADAGGAAPRTLAALAALRGKLAGAQLVLTLGGMGATQAELEATLGALVEGAAWAVVALPGDLEPAGAQAAAIARLRAKGRAIFDGRLARRIELPGAVIAAIPGAGAEARLVAGAEGCGYRTSDVDAALDVLTKRDELLRILVSAEAPRIEVGGEPAGELALTAGETRAIDIALHAPTAEVATPERAGRRDGSGVALTPGSSDATVRLPGPRRAPSAGVLSINGGAWRWRPITGQIE